MSSENYEESDYGDDCTNYDVFHILQEVVQREKRLFKTC